MQLSYPSEREEGNSQELSSAPFQLSRAGEKERKKKRREDARKKGEGKESSQYEKHRCAYHSRQPGDRKKEKEGEESQDSFSTSTRFFSEALQSKILLFAPNFTQSTTSEEPVFKNTVSSLKSFRNGL